MWGMGVLVCLPNQRFHIHISSFTWKKQNPLLIVFLPISMDFFLRIVVHHFAEPMNNDSVDRIVTERPWSTLPSPSKDRVLEVDVGSGKVFDFVSSTWGNCLSYRCCFPWRTVGRHFPLISKKDIDSFPVRKKNIDRNRYQRRDWRFNTI